MSVSDDPIKDCVLHSIGIIRAYWDSDECRIKAEAVPLEEFFQAPPPSNGDRT